MQLYHSHVAEDVLLASIRRLETDGAQSPSV